jgi:hypothetical protein
MIEGTSGRYVEKEWVCATPAEFTEKLKKLFALDHVKTRIISLQAPTIGKPQEAVAEDAKEESLEGENESGPEDGPDLFEESPGPV